MSERVQVVVRLRPFIPSDPPDAELNTLVLDSTHLRVGDSRVFTVDRVFMMEHSSEEVYSSVVAPLIHRFLDGCNASVLAYGQTGTGKTFTVQSMLPLLLSQVLNSPALGGGSGTPSNAVLARLKQQPLLRLQYVEVYGESIRDLLEDPRTRADPSKPPKLRLVTTPSAPPNSPQCSVVGATVVSVCSIREAAAYIASGDARRATGATNVHERSSRSHAILTFFHPRYACRLDVVDLAGSEREKKTGNTGLRFQESIAINTGLLALGNVIRALSRNHRTAVTVETQRGAAVHPPRLHGAVRSGAGDAQLLGDKSAVPGSSAAAAAAGAPATGSRHVPYRSSKLTRLLQDTLGGSSATLFIACVAPDSYNRDETLRTLQYCSLALQVVNVPSQQLERLHRAQSRERGGGGGKGSGVDDATGVEARSALEEVRAAYVQLQQHYDEQGEVLASVCESHAAAKEQLEVWGEELKKDADLFTRQTRLIRRLVKENKALRHQLNTTARIDRVPAAETHQQQQQQQQQRHTDVRGVAPRTSPEVEGAAEECSGEEEDAVRALLQRLLKQHHSTRESGEDAVATVLDSASAAAAAERGGVGPPPLPSTVSPYRHLSFQSGSVPLGSGSQGGASGDAAVSQALSVPLRSVIRSLLRQHGIHTGTEEEGTGGGGGGGDVHAAAVAARSPSPQDASPVVNSGDVATPTSTGQAADRFLPPQLDVQHAAAPHSSQQDQQLLQLAGEVVRYEETNNDLRNQVRLLQVRLDDKTREAARLRLEVQDMRDVYSSLSALTD